jgi:hypothetical protein
MRVRLAKDDGSFVESEDLDEATAGDLHSRYLRAINFQDLMRPVQAVEGPTYGLPSVFYTNGIRGVSLVK